MDNLVKKELDTLKQMARNWLRGYKTWTKPGEDNEFACIEFLEEMQTHLVPYLIRLEQTGYIDQTESHDIFEYFKEQAKELKGYGKATDKN